MLGPQADIRAWREHVNSLKEEMKNATTRLSGKKMSLQKALVRKYNCGEINGHYFRMLRIPRRQTKFFEQRDKQMSTYIHQLLQNSTNNRYFFAVGAGMNTDFLSVFLSMIVFLPSTYGRSLSKFKSSLESIRIQNDSSLHRSKAYHVSDLLKKNSDRIFRCFRKKYGCKKIKPRKECLKKKKKLD